MKTSLITDGRKLVEDKLEEKPNGPPYSWDNRRQDPPTSLAQKWRMLRGQPEPGTVSQAEQDAKAKQLIVSRIHDLESGKEGHSSDMQRTAQGAFGGAALFGAKGAVIGGLLGSLGKSDWHDAKKLRDKASLSRCPECGGDVHKSASSCPFCHKAHRPGVMFY
jgi:hypothetical protein